MLQQQKFKLWVLRKFEEYLEFQNKLNQNENKNTWIFVILPNKIKNIKNYLNFENILLST